MRHKLDKRDIQEAERLKGILKQARKKLGYSQKDMAEMIGITQAMYGRIEQDFKAYSTYRQEEICNLLFLPEPIILGGKSNEHL